MIRRIKLIIPIAIISTITILANSFFDYGGLLINIGTELLGIIVTVIYVDILLERHEKQKWQQVEENLKKELYKVSNVTVSSLRTAFRLSYDDMVGTGALYSAVNKTESELALEILDSYERVIKPKLYYYLSKMTLKEWETLMKNYSNLHNACINYQSMYNSISTPRQISCIMNVTNATFNITSQFIIFPDIITTSDEELLEKYDEEKVILKKLIIEKVCENLNDLIDMLRTEVTLMAN